MFGNKNNQNQNPNNRPPYIVKQVVLTEAFFGTGSDGYSLTNLQGVINRQVAQYTLYQQLHQDLKASLVVTKFKQQWFLRD